MLTKTGSAKKHKQLLSRAVLVVFCASLVLTVVSFVPPKAHAAATDIKINEIMYNPSSGVDGDEFVELYNTSGSTVDLSNWCFTAGITLCFSGGTTIASHAYALVSPNASQTLATYGKTTIGTYTGKLDNGGERITLRDETSTISNDFTYDDVSPWPTAPDGTGPSLELLDPTYDNTLAASWAASIGGSTPGVVNSVYGASPPTIDNVSHPTNVQPSNSVTITAQVENATSVTLNYKVMFGSDVSVTMYDDGAHGDSGSGDNIYGASIPGQAAGQLVRYNIQTSNGDGPKTAPSSDDTMTYYGYVVQDSPITTNAQVIKWYIDDAVYDDLTTNGPNTLAKYPCVIVYGDTVYDNSQVRIKGNNTLYFDKHNYKMYLPKGYTIQPTGADYPVDEFHMNADFREESIGKVPAFWWVAKQAGLPTPSVVTTRLLRNNQFEGAYNFLDKYERAWSQANDFDNGSLFEDLNLEEGPGPSQIVLDWQTAMDGDPHDSATRDYVLDNNDIPNLINFMVFAALTRNLDQVMNHNVIQFYNSDNQRWKLLAWDLDLTMIVFDNRTLVSPFDLYPGQYGLRQYATAIYNQPDLRQAYFRRLRTVIDKVYSNDAFINKYDELYNLYADEITLDNAKWSGPGRTPHTDDRAQIAMQKTFLTAYLRQDWAVPAAQTNTERQAVTISDVNNSLTSGEQYIKLSNASSQAVDVSGWVLDGANYTIPAGSVIPGGGDIYLVRDDIGFKVAHSSVLVGGQYGSDLGLTGLITLLTDTGTEIDSYVY